MALKISTRICGVDVPEAYARVVQLTRQGPTDLEVDAPGTLWTAHVAIYASEAYANEPGAEPLDRYSVPIIQAEGETNLQAIAYDALSATPKLAGSIAV